MTDGSNRVYSWLPNAAAETSKPLPTFPCARQWTYWAKLCASFLPGDAVAEPPSLGSGTSKESEGITFKWRRSAETRDVIRAADEPSPVL